MRVLFYLPAPGRGGGTHSIVQECKGMRLLGAEPAIAVPAASMASFQASYHDLQSSGVSLISVDGPQELVARMEVCDVVCATTSESVHVLKDAIAMASRRCLPAYYVQDYEPLFFTPGTDRWRRAIESYSAIQSCVLFAKTDWLCTIVKANTGVEVGRVQPSIDHSIYCPGALNTTGRIAISAMLRPSTPRRAPHRTLRILKRLISAYGERVDITVFGASRAELDDYALQLPSAIANKGVVTQAEVADVLRSSDLFLDLSDYQAFGRTGIEAMACGCIPMLPLFGGAVEFARNGENGILIDTRSDDEVISKVDAFMEMSAEARQTMRMSAIRTANVYTIERAAASEMAIFSGHLGRN